VEPKAVAVSGYVRRKGKPAWIGSLTRIEEALAGEAGTCIQWKEIFPLPEGERN